MCPSRVAANFSRNAAERFHQGVVQRAEVVRKLLPRPVEHVAREQAAPRAQLHHLDLFRRTQHAPHLFELAGHQASEDGVHVARSVEITGFAKLLFALGVVTEAGLVETHFHVARKRDRAALPNLLLDTLAQDHVRSFRSWGVRMNISMK